ncbi:class I SAM-dependent methyltransferase [Verrucosispora sp. WMMD1129]|uniref:class I SAM-dependent methyltransferase n=1 Tax=Verrucosispora sp. WMMD1129 TaxID=3016093 RepID=UPI00249A82D6|nr:class I SAM-dependent methyltransferase [Verrucosispora sp. WMMD1129]WFE47798.1 class I SAM-dependent methyltransferase [Verrucosispora sp. WMMD1129]
MDEMTLANRTAWDKAYQAQQLHAYDEMSAEAATGVTLVASELELLRDILTARPVVVHPQSGNGQDDIALVQAGAREVIGVDYSETVVHAARGRADALGVACRYLIATVPGVPLLDGCADLVYTGKGALIWMPDIDAWAVEMARLLRPGGHLFLHEGHPATELWTWDLDEPRIRPDRSYFGRSFVCDDNSFPANGAVMWQWTLGQTVSAVVRAGLQVRCLEEYAEPFWRMGDIDAAAFRGRLPNTFALLARRPAAP